MPHVTVEKVRQVIIKELEDIKAEDIVVIGLTGKSDIADYMICLLYTSPSPRD